MSNLLYNAPPRAADTRSTGWVDITMALTGVAFFAVMVAGFTVGSSSLTTLEVSGATAVRDWADRHGRLDLRLALLELAAFLALVFAVEARHRLRIWGADREAQLTWGGGLVLAVMVALSGWVSAAVAAVDSLQGHEDAAFAFLLLDWAFGSGVSAGLAAMVVGVTVASLRTGALPRWFAAVGVIVLVAFCLNAAWWQTGSLAALGLAWIPALSILLALATDDRRLARASR